MKDTKWKAMKGKNSQSAGKPEAMGNANDTRYAGNIQGTGNIRSIGDAQSAREEMLLHEKVDRLLLRLAVPAVISMLITSIYNMADTYFVSQINTAASGAVGIIYSAMTMIQAIAFTIGMGAGNNMSRLLGEGRKEEARVFVSTSFFSGLILGSFLALGSLLFLDPLIDLLGATDTIAPYAAAYARYIFLATPFLMCSLILNNTLRLQGLAAYAMVGVAAGGILNIILDPVFIFTLGFETAGAGMATGLSQFVSFVILLIMCEKRQDAIPVQLKNFHPGWKIYGQIFYVGMPSLFRQGIVSISTVVLNTVAGGYGDAAIAAMSIVSRYTMFINSVIMGFGQGFQPVCAFNYGAREYGRVRAAFWFCVRVMTAALLVMSGISLLLSENIIRFFRKEDLDVIRIGTFALQAQMCTMPLWGFYTMSNMCPQSLGYGTRAALISSARNGLFMIPALLILPRFWELTGIQIAQPICDVFATVLAAFVMKGILRDLREKEEAKQRAVDTEACPGE